MIIKVKRDACLFNPVAPNGNSVGAFKRADPSLVVPDMFVVPETTSHHSKTKPCMRWFSLVVALFLFSCSNKKNAPDVSGINIDVKVHRFDKDFFAIDTAHLQTSLQAIEQKYPAFLAVYFKYFAPVGEIAQQQNIPFDSA